MKRFCLKNLGCGAYLLAFGGGLLVAVICPPRFLVILMALGLVGVGIALIKCLYFR